MRILDSDGNELDSYDLDKGFVEEEEIDTTFHEAQEEVQEQSHYEVIQEYPNGGKDVEKVIDVPYQAAREAYYDKETILRYHPYTEEELKERQEAVEKAQNNELKINSLLNSDLTFSDVVDAIALLSYGGDVS